MNRENEQELLVHFLNANQELSDRQLLELVLSRTVEASEIDRVANLLLGKFGTFAEIVSAEILRILELPIVSVKTVKDLKLFQKAGIRLARGEIYRKPLLNSWSALIDYCHASFAFSNIEKFAILFLDNKSHLIADEVQQTGTIDHTPVYIREVIKRSLELSAKSIVIVHNHPSGDPTPSLVDIDITKKICRAGELISLDVRDHIIIGRLGYVSFRNLQLI